MYREIILALVPSFFFDCIPAQKPLQLHEIKFSHEIEAELESGIVDQVRAFNAHSAAYYYTYIGRYEKALETYELHLDWGMDTLCEKDSLYFLGFKPVNAIDYIVERAGNERIIIISEAHQKPQHRVITRLLLNKLYDIGFRYLGIEALTPSFEDSTKLLLDTMLNSRGYPLNSPFTGTYTQEPQMANLVRKALEVGYEIFGYERGISNLERDLKQALNIKAFIESRPNAKVLIHCGWYHAIESDFPKRQEDHYLAYHFKRLTGIDPLTVYQDLLSERKLIPESPYYSMIDHDEVAVFINENGEVFHGPPGLDHFDILVYHPRTQYVFNRPTWLLNEPEMKVWPIPEDLIEIEYPVIVRAWNSDEPEEAVPIDIIEVESVDEQAALVLPPGKYRVWIHNPAVERQELEIKVE